VFSGEPHVLVSADTRQKPAFGKIGKVMKISICNLWSINNAGRPGFNRLYTKYYRLTTNWPSTTVEDSLQISPFMQNKANLLDTQMNVNSSITKDYENISDWTLGENKPNTKPIKAKQSQYKANTKPKKANTNPIQSQYKPNTKPKKAKKMLLSTFLLWDI